MARYSVTEITGTDRDKSRTEGTRVFAVVTDGVEWKWAPVSFTPRYAQGKVYCSVCSSLMHAESSTCAHASAVKRFLIKENPDVFKSDEDDGPEPERIFIARIPYRYRKQLRERASLCEWGLDEYIANVIDAHLSSTEPGTL